MDFFHRISDFITRRLKGDAGEDSGGDNKIHVKDEVHVVHECPSPGESLHAVSEIRDSMVHEDSDSREQDLFTNAESSEIDELFIDIFEFFVAQRDRYLAILFDPEEEECFVYYYDNKEMHEVRRISRSLWDTRVGALKALEMKTVTLLDKVYLCGLLLSFSDFGERISVIFHQADQGARASIKEQEKACIKLINTLKPATSLTEMNKKHLIEFVEKHAAHVQARLPDIMLSEGLITRNFMEEAERISHESGQSVESVLLRKGGFPRKRISLVIGMWVGVPYVDIEEEKIDLSLFQKADPSFCQVHRLIPFREEESELLVTAAFPFIDSPLADLARIFNKKVSLHISAEGDIRGKISSLQKALLDG